MGGAILRARVFIGARLRAWRGYGYGILEPIGIHCLAELYGCPPHLLDDESFIRKVLSEAVEQGLATLIHKVSHHFHPQGVTALALIAESHVAIHTWPEYGYTAIDVFTCGNRASAQKACLYLVGALKAARHVIKRVDRGTEVDPELVRRQPLGTMSGAPS